MPNHIIRQSPTLGLRRVSTELKRLREAAGLTTTDAARAVGKHPSLLTRLERREVKRVDREFVAALLKLYGADVAEADAVLGWTRQANEPGWWHEHRTLLADHTTYLGLETEARVLRVFEPLVIPGLLQTSCYTAALIRARMAGVTEDEVERRVKIRMDRQTVLLDGHDQVERLKVVVGEAALLQPAGGRDVMVRQLEHLVQMANHPHVELYILPLSRGIPPGRAPFTIMTFRNPLDGEVVYVDALTGETWLEGEELVREHEATFERLLGWVLSKADSVTYLSRLAESMAGRPEEYGSRDYNPLVEMAQVESQRQ